MTDTAEILLLDDDPSVRAGVGSLLEAGGYSVRTFARTPEFMEAARATGGPVVVLIDICLADADGLDIPETLRAEGIACLPIVMTAHADLPVAVRAIRADVLDFLEKPFTRKALFAAVDRALEKWKGAVAADEPELATLRERHAGLSPREREVFKGMARGCSTKLIARDLGISPRTVEVHRSNVLHKMEAENIADLARMAISLGHGFR
ncbi:MAG: LuxR C-terminal-related transcriptional regulator [Pseudomonadota bacterium]